MRPAKEKRPPDGDPGALKQADVVSLPAARNSNKTARTRFLRLMEEARLHFLRSVAARRVAWELYRQATGLPRRPRWGE